jgi:hypothetical protein
MMDPKDDEIEGMSGFQNPPFSATTVEKPYECPDRSQATAGSLAEPAEGRRGGSTTPYPVSFAGLDT